MAPVQTRLSYYASSKRARAILGQPQSTIDLRRTILEGGILLVSTAQGTVGRDVAALVGASLLNLVDSVIREQERLPLAQRRGALVVVDEMQTIPGVEFESMLAELGKYGASFVLATQSLAKLADLSPTMRHTLLANVGCLCVFQVSGEDARQLVWELGRERVSEEDIVSQPVHHCYVRATVGTERMPVFSMTVRKPDPGDPLRAARIREASSAYVTSARELERRQEERQRAVAEFRERIEAQREADRAPKPKNKGKAARPEPKTARSDRANVQDPHRRSEKGLTDEALSRRHRTVEDARRVPVPGPAGTGRAHRPLAGRRLPADGTLHRGWAGRVSSARPRNSSRRPAGSASPPRACAGSPPKKASPSLNCCAPSPSQSSGAGCMLERLDAAAVIYRLAEQAAQFAFPLGLRWLRAAPMDALLELPDGPPCGGRAPGPDRRPVRVRQAHPPAQGDAPATARY